MLLASAILVCVIGVGAFWVATDYQADTRWIFFGLNGIGFVAVVARKFPNQGKDPSFILFFMVWLIAHGIIATTLAASLPILYWVPIFGVELFVGFLVADMMFGLPLDRH